MQRLIADIFSDRSESRSLHDLPQSHLFLSPLTSSSDVWARDRIPELIRALSGTALLPTASASAMLWMRTDSLQSTTSPAKLIARR